jgi:hypothetical protein
MPHTVPSRSRSGAGQHLRQHRMQRFPQCRPGLRQRLAQRLRLALTEVRQTGVVVQHALFRSPRQETWHALVEQEARGVAQRRRPSRHRSQRAGAVAQHAFDDAVGRSAGGPVWICHGVEIRRGGCGETRILTFTGGNEHKGKTYAFINFVNYNTYFLFKIFFH